MKNIIVIALIIAAFAGGYFFSQKYNFKLEPKTEEQIIVSPTSHLVGNDADSHGCRGSAGYSWCEAKQKCLRIWEEPCQEKTSSDEAEITTALLKKHRWNSEDIIVTVSENNGSYARGGVREKSSEVGGGMFLAMKKLGIWEIVFDGNGGVDCVLIKSTYQFPVSMLKGVCD